MLTEWIVPPKWIEFIGVNLCCICLYLRLKKENLLTADDKRLTLIHADEQKRDRNNSDANRMDCATEMDRIHRR